MKRLYSIGLSLVALACLAFSAIPADAAAYHIGPAVLEAAAEAIPKPPEVRTSDVLFVSPAIVVTTRAGTYCKAISPPTAAVEFTFTGDVQRTSFPRVQPIPWR